MLQPRRGGAYLCWNCLSRSLGPMRRQAAGSLQRPRPTSRLPALLASSRTFATVKHRGPPHGSSPQGGAAPELPPVRQRLAQWDREHGQPTVADKDNMVFRLPWSAQNRATRSQTSHGAVDLDEEAAAVPGEEVDFDLDQDLQPLSSGIQVGDLVEFASNIQRSRQLAVCVARVDGIDHFYADNGTWAFTRAAATMFIVPGFASEAEIAPVRDALPPAGTSLDALYDMRDKRLGPGRSLGAGLLRKMIQFASDANAVMQKHSSRIETAHDLVLPSGRSFITASEAADLVLPHHARDQDTLEFPRSAVYAVHRALCRHEVGFRPFVRTTFHGRGCLFEVLPEQDVAAVRAAESMIRAYYLDQYWQSSESLTEKRRMKHRLGRFAARARRQIDRSRRLCDHVVPTKGLLGPGPRVAEAEAEAQAVAGADDAPLQAAGWLDEEDQQIMHFMYIWAACRKFSPSSRINVFGATILKVLGRYDHHEQLDVSTGWTFLQEVGWVLPWDFATRHSLPPPGLDVSRTGGLLNQPPPVDRAALERDSYPGTRRDWGDTKIYCIDAASTADVDDGLSIERADTPGQYWIHVHVADPASAIGPEDPAAKYAETISQTIYLPGHYDRMFPDNAVMDRFSLAPGRRCLTFSAKVDESGALLDLDITPGILRNVVYVTVDELAAACPLPPGPTLPQQSIRVGPELPPEEVPSAAVKPLTSISDLSAEEVEDIKLLSRLTEARRALLEANGGMPQAAFRPRPVARASFENTRVVPARDGSFRALGDPSIEVSYPANNGHPIVATSMVLAGEVAGRWCAARGIAMPYRTMPQAELNKAVLLPWARSVFYPKALSDQGLEMTDETTFAALAGHHQLSATPGSYFLLGLDVYVKVTSPLRRYADMLAHWQIHAALAEEAKKERGRGSLALVAPATTAAAAVATQDRAFLPFSQAQLTNEVLPMLKIREFAAGRLSRENSLYSLQALARAWLFGQAPLPETFVFRISRPRLRRPIQGSFVDFFDVRGFLVPADSVKEEQPVDLASLETDDLVEVKLKSVDPSTPLVLVEAVRKLDNRS